MRTREIESRCRHCGFRKREHKKALQCPTKLFECWWTPWTLEEYCAAQMEKHYAAQMEKQASREEQHARYIDCGPGAWDDK